MDASLARTLERTGRIGFFVLAPSRVEPAVIAKWAHHETSVLAHLTSTAKLVPPPSLPAGGSWVVWRLLSGNNREIGRGVGAHAGIDVARRSALVAIAAAGLAEPVLAFDRKSAHAWCLQVGGSPILISPAWHRSRRTNRLNLETVRATLGQAEVNGAVTSLDGQARRAAVSS